MVDIRIDHCAVCMCLDSASQILYKIHVFLKLNYENGCDFECLKFDGVDKFLTLSFDEDDGGSLVFVRSWYS